MVSSKRLLVCVCVLLLLCGAGVARSADVIPLLDPLSLTKFQDPLYMLTDNIAVPDGVSDGVPLYDINISQFTWNFSSQGALADGTTVWGYGCVQPDGTVKNSMPGPTFLVNSGSPIAVRYTNKLVDANGNALSQFLPVDTTLLPSPNGPTNMTAVHLHGGHVPGIYDGDPWSQFGSSPLGGPYGTSPSGVVGPIGNSIIYQYPNNQQAALIWYHDHSWGETHLNPYAGMAGGYEILDTHELSLNLPTLVPLVLQDKMFTASGQLFYPRGPGDLTDPGGPNPLVGLPADFPSPNSAVSEFFGNINLVNGKVWPIMDVEAKKYRFQELNGSQARTYMLEFTTPSGTVIPFKQIGSDGGLLPDSVTRNIITIMPGERLDTIVDFSGLTPGTLVTMKNYGPDDPWDGNTTFSQTVANANTTGQVMQFRIGSVTTPDTSSSPDHPALITRLQRQDATVHRDITIMEMPDQYGRTMIVLNGKGMGDPVTETINLGDTETWRFMNMTPDAHPMHLHDVEFQVLGRQALMLDDSGIPMDMVDPNAPFLTPDAWEMGWKDTLACPPGFATEIIAKFEDYTGDYVYHCHILEHEEFDMMRPFIVMPEPATMSLLALGAVLAIVRRGRRG